MIQEEKKTAAHAMGDADKNTGAAVPPVPGELPVIDERSVFTHTMQEDVLRAKADPSQMAKEKAAKKPFAEYIPPPPAPPSEKSAPAHAASKDAYREAVGAPAPERDQPFAFPKKEEEQAPADEKTQPFQIYIPPKKSAFGASTAILSAILLLIIAGGGFGYWWFFMKTQEPQLMVQEPELPPEPEPIPTPVIEPEPEPAPVIPEPPLVIPAPPEPIIATSTPPVIEPIIEPTPVIPVVPEPEPIAEPVAPQAVLALNQTITIEIAQPDKTALLEKLKAENAKITAKKATIRYVVKISSATEKRYLSLSEIGTLLGFTVSEAVAQSLVQSDFIGYKNGNAFRYGFAAAISQKESAKAAALAWEQTALEDLKGLYIQKPYVKPASPVFSENTYLNFFKRYLNMPQPDVSLDFAVSEKYFIAATSKEMIYAIIDAAQLSAAAPVIIGK